MMHIEIICVGRIKETYFADAIREYCKRICAYAKIDITEVKDEPTPDQPSENEKKKILSTEGERIRKCLREKAYRIALAVEGKQTDSPGFAKMLQNPAVQGYSMIQFVIGGSLGMDESIKKEAHERISFSGMTFPHQLMRVILLEQIYRGYRILQGAPYHK